MVREYSIAICNVYNKLGPSPIGIPLTFKPRIAQTVKNISKASDFLLKLSFFSYRRR